MKQWPEEEERCWTLAVAVFYRLRDKTVREAIGLNNHFYFSLCVDVQIKWNDTHS